MANKKFEDIKDYADNKEGGRRREYRKKYSKKNRRDIPKNQGEIKDDVDSDGFEIVGSKEEKKQKFRDEHRGDYIPRRGRGNWKRNIQKHSNRYIYMRVYIRKPIADQRKILISTPNKEISTR